MNKGPTWDFGRSFHGTGAASRGLDIVDGFNTVLQESETLSLPERAVLMLTQSLRNACDEIEWLSGMISILEDQNLSMHLRGNNLMSEIANLVEHIPNAVAPGGREMEHLRWCIENAEDRHRVYSFHSDNVYVFDLGRDAIAFKMMFC